MNAAGDTRGVAGETRPGTGYRWNARGQGDGSTHPFLVARGGAGADTPRAAAASRHASTWGHGQAETLPTAAADRAEAIGPRRCRRAECEAPEISGATRPAPDPRPRPAAARGPRRCRRARRHTRPPGEDTRGAADPSGAGAEKRDAAGRRCRVTRRRPQRQHGQAAEAATGCDASSFTRPARSLQGTNRSDPCPNLVRDAGNAGRATQRRATQPPEAMHRGPVDYSRRLDRSRRCHGDNPRPERPSGWTLPSGLPPHGRQA